MKSFQPSPVPVYEETLKDQHGGQPDEDDFIGDGRPRHHFGRKRTGLR